VLTGRGLLRLIGRLHRRGLRRSFHDRLVGEARKIGAGDKDSDGEKEDLTHGTGPIDTP